MTNPREKEIVVEKIKNGDVKVKGTRTHVPKREHNDVPAKAEKAKVPAVVRENLAFTEAQTIAAVKAVGHAATSREISDKLGFNDPDQGRGYIRTRMAALVKDGKIVTSKPNDAKSRCTFLYSVA